MHCLSFLAAGSGRLETVSGYREMNQGRERWAGRYLVDSTSALTTACLARYHHGLESGIPGSRNHRVNRYIARDTILEARHPAEDWPDSNT